MPKPLFFKIAVEEIAAGSVMRKLHEMPGVLEFGPIFEEPGGMGAGRKELEKAAADRPVGNHTQNVIKQLMDGPKTLGELAAALVAPKTSLYGVVSKLKKDGVAENIDGRWQLSPTSKQQLGNTQINGSAVVPALPAPALQVKHDAAGRAAPGSGNKVLHDILSNGGAMQPKAIREQMEPHGLSAKSVSGLLFRAKKEGLIKRNGAGYVLTAKGQKIEVTEATANG